jgi:S-adenosylmethionine/arginine decarboxylase-like enzyme
MCLSNSFRCLFLSCFIQAFERITDVFEHTLQHQNHDVPKVCTQNFVVASHDIDLLHRNLTDHNIQTLYVEPLDLDDDRLEMVHDYRRNPDNKYKKMCKAHKDEKEELTTQQGSSGIFMVVEAQEVTMDLQSIKNVQNAVTKTLKKAGFKIESFAVRKGASYHSEISSVETLLILREGYVAIRTWPEHKYVAFDIHLWSSFEKHEAAKKAVVTGVGGKMATTSSYRIVAGGMFGVSTWKDDVKMHGPHIHNVCDQSSLPVRDAPMDIGSVELAIEAGLSLVLDEKKYVAAAICGNEGACRSIELLKKNEMVGEVMPLYLCSDLKLDDQHSEDGRMRIVECERGILKNLQESLSNGKRLRVVIVDRSAPRLLVQMLLRIFTKGWDNESMLAQDIMVLTTIEDESEQWKRNFLEKIRKDIIKVDPLFRAEILFNTTASSMELGILSSGDESFMKHLTDMADTVEKKSGLALEIRGIFGGKWRPTQQLIMLDEEAEVIYTHESYNRTSPLEQWWSQQPVGHQTLFQFEARPLLVGDHVHAYFRGVPTSRLPVGLITAVHNENSYDVKFEFTSAFVYHQSFITVGGERHGTSVPRHELRKISGSPNDEKLSAEKVMIALQYALSNMDSRTFSASEIHELEVDGDGCLLVAFCFGGSIILMWDGRIHIDVNLFTFFESPRAHGDFELRLKTKLRSLEAILQDEQPRGFGRVVNFERDLGKGEREAPYWA